MTDSHNHSQEPERPSFLFTREAHIRYFSQCLHSPLPAHPYQTLDTSRMTLVHFCVNALDLLGVLPPPDDEDTDETHSDDEQQGKTVVNATAIKEWILSLQQQDGGFAGGTFLGPEQQQASSSACSSAGNEILNSTSTNTTAESIHREQYAHSHIAMTYTALATLTALGVDDLHTVVNVDGIVQTLQKLQNTQNGSFQAVVNMPSEQDMRFLYCACAISYMIQDWRGVDTEAAVKYIQSCVSFDGGIALLPGQEGHGGSTFCGVASLILMDKLDCMPQSFESNLLYWCVSRQVGGMQGRPNKLEDTCYSYWIGGTLSLLGKQDLLDEDALSAYVMSCQTPMGGFSKVVGAHPDVLHSFYSMAWLSLARHSGSDDNNNDVNVASSSAAMATRNRLKALNCTLGICQERAAVFDGYVP